MSGGQKHGPDIITVLGPTASGKTALAVRVARAVDGEIISADSRQVYIGMDVGTGKDLADYRIDGRNIPYHLIDIIPPEENFSVFDFQQRFHRVSQDIRERGMVPIMAGGTGLYLDAVLRGYRMLSVPENPALRCELDAHSMEELKKRLLELNPRPHNTTDFNSRETATRAIEILEHQRRHSEDGYFTPPPVRSLNFGICWERGALRERIRRRLRDRLQSGMIEEAQRLHKAGLSWERFAYFGLEYKYLALHLQGRMSLREMEEELGRQIGRFAKRQETWFRRMEKQGVKIHWVAPGNHEEVLRVIASSLNHE